MASRVLAIRLMVDWDFDGTYTDESAYLISADGDMRLAPFGAGLAGSQGMVSAASITLRNASGRFSPLRTDGALYSAIRDGKAYHAPCYIEVSINGGTNYSRVFTGVLKLPQESTLTPQESATVTFVARSMEEMFLQRRVSLTRAQFAALHDAGATESEILAEFLHAADVEASLITLDAGLFVIPWAWLDDESAIEESWALAAACGGRFYADPDGEFRYMNLANWQTAARSTSTQFALTRDTLSSFSLRLEDQDLHNVVTVEASPRAAGALDVVWEPESPPVFAPGETRTITARYDAPAYSIWGVQHSAFDQGGNDRTSSVTVAATYYAQRADLVVENASALQVLLHPLRVLGVTVTGGPEIEERRTSADDGANGAYWTGRGDRTLSLRGNPYIQRPEHAGALAQFLLDRCEYPRLTALAGLPGQPSMRLGDRVTVADAPTMSATFTGYVTSIRWSYGVGLFDQNIELLSASQMFAHDGEYFVLGTDTFGDEKRVFY